MSHFDIDKNLKLVIVFLEKTLKMWEILNISKQGGVEKYLGLPEQFGRKKKEIFEYILNRVQQRTSSWSAKFLSQAGK